MPKTVKDGVASALRSRQRKMVVAWALSLAWQTNQRFCSMVHFVQFAELCGLEVNLEDYDAMKWHIPTPEQQINRPRNAPPPHPFYSADQVAVWMKKWMKLATLLLLEDVQDELVEIRDRFFIFNVVVFQFHDFHRGERR